MLSSPAHLNFGQQAEQKALTFLQTNGLKLLEKNFNCRHGEIDIIMQEGNDIVFVEVRGRKQKEFGSAAESINQNKIKKIVQTAAYYLQKNKLLYKVSSRFDIMAIHFISNHWQYEWIKDAFSADTF